MVYALGESLLDIIFSEGKPISASAGGSMLNVAVSLARSGVVVSLISETGDDETAKIILSFLKNNKVGTKFIKHYYHQKTTIALAHLDQQKIPSFSIYKSYPEIRRLITPKEFVKGDILIFGSMYSFEPAIRNEVLEVISQATRGGAFIIYDPNIRKHNLGQPSLKKALYENFAFADIIKGSDEDFKNIFGDLSFEEINNKIRKINPEAAVIITLGKEGVIAFGSNKTISLTALKTKVVSTIGAGDAFSAGLVYFIEHLKGQKDLSFIARDQIFEGMLKSGLQFSAEVCATLDNFIRS